jgi:hypothetical protein
MDKILKLSKEQELRFLDDFRQSLSRVIYWHENFDRFDRIVSAG